MRLFLTCGTAFFAGALSLVSQIIGLRVVSRELSASEFTVASVLVCALCGLSLGALIAGRLADRKQLKPPNGESTSDGRSGNALAFGNVLLGLAAMAVLVLALAGRELADGLRGFGEESLQVFCFLLVTVLPINLLLGGIVPVLTKAMSKTVDDVQAAFGWVYAWETFGAAVGAWGVVFVAVPTLGAIRSLSIAAAVVLGWAIISLLFGRRQTETMAVQEKESGSAEIINASATTQNATTPLLRWLLLFAALASSCASLGMELVWQRYFAVVFGSDSHSYAVVATVFLVGNSIGALLASRILRVNNASRKLYQWLLLLIGGSILLSVWSLEIWFRLETLTWVLGWLSQYPLLGRLLMAAAVLLLPAILIGTALPVLVKIWSTGKASLSTRAGQIYGCVIVGNVVGVLVCACWLIPMFGLQVTAIILASVCVLASIGIFFLTALRPKGNRTIGSSLLSTGFWLVVGGLIGLVVLISNSSMRPGMDETGEWIVDHYVERASHTVAVTHRKDSPANKRLMIDGVKIGESGGGVDEKQQVLAHLPFMIGDAKRSKVLTIGLGTGILAGELAANDQVESVTCVEISAAVIEASQWFAEENRQVLAQPKFKLVHGDGVRYLRAAETDFDVIVSDGKSRPGAASNLPFFSQEYYQICADGLSEDGVFVQWVSLLCDQHELETILKTFCGEFPFGHIAVAAPGSVYLVGTRSPVTFDPAGMEAYLQGPSTGVLKSYGWAAGDDVLAMYWLDQAVVQKALADVSPNTFDRPVLENFAWASYGHSVSLLPTQLPMIQRLIEGDEHSMFNGQPLSDSEFQPTAQLIGKGRLATAELIAAETILFVGEEDWLDRATVHFKKAIQLLPQLNRQQHVVKHFRALAVRSKIENDIGTEFSALLNISELNAVTALDEYRMGEILDFQNRGDLSLEHFYQAVKLSDQHPRYLISFGQALLRQRKVSAAMGQFERAIRAIETAEDDSEFDSELKPTAELMKGIALLKLRQTATGEAIVREVLTNHPELQDLFIRYQN